LQQYILLTECGPQRLDIRIQPLLCFSKDPFLAAAFLF
jgi:hypothetical protein